MACEKHYYVKKRKEKRFKKETHLVLTKYNTKTVAQTAPASTNL